MGKRQLLRTSNRTATHCWRSGLSSHFLWRGPSSRGLCTGCAAAGSFRLRSTGLRSESVCSRGRLTGRTNRDCRAERLIQTLSDFSGVRSGIAEQISGVGDIGRGAASLAKDREKRIIEIRNGRDEISGRRLRDFPCLPAKRLGRLRNVGPGGIARRRNAAEHRYVFAGNSGMALESVAEDREKGQPAPASGFELVIE